MSPISFIFSRLHFALNFSLSQYCAGMRWICAGSQMWMGELHQIGKCCGTISLVTLIKTLIWAAQLGLERGWIQQKEAHLRLARAKIWFRQKPRGNLCISSFCPGWERPFYGIEWCSKVSNLDFYIWGWIGETPLQFFRCSASPNEGFEHFSKWVTLWNWSTNGL